MVTKFAVCATNDPQVGAAITTSVDEQTSPPSDVLVWVIVAACDNVSVKISGLAMFDHEWTVDSLRPYVLETIDAFGTDRAMFASNFPVDRLFGSYPDLWRAYASIVDGASVSEKEALFCRNAERYYRI